MADECVALYKQSYSLEKEVSGHESPLLAVHLQKLGAAYERQGKMGPNPNPIPSPYPSPNPNPYPSPHPNPNPYPSPHPNPNANP